MYVCTYMMGNKGGEGMYTFAKLKGTENYKGWAREMSFALRDAGLISYANGTAVKPNPYRKEECASVSEEKIEKREADIEKWILNDSRTGEKIGKMCTTAVQQLIKDEWSAKKMWDELKLKYTADRCYSKWQILNRLEEGSYASSKDMQDFGLRMKILLEEVDNLNITIKEWVLIKIINSLGPTFETYVTVLNKKARTEKSLPDLDALVKSLEEEEIRLSGKNLLNTVQGNSQGGSSRGRGRGGQRSRGGGRGGSQNSTEPKDYSNVTCYRCDKKVHSFRDCPTKETEEEESTQGKSGKHLGAMMLNSSHSGDPINQNLLDSGATEHANNCRDAFTNFRSVRETAHTATGEAIVSYGRGDVVKMMSHGEVTFQEVLYIPTLVNNLYSTSRLCCWGWDILMKHTGQAVLSHNDEVVGFADEVKGEYIMRFIGDTPHLSLNALAKPTKDLKLWHGRVAHLGYRNLIWMKKLCAWHG